ncbi:MAG: Multidrug export protein EmrA [Chlamydiia bacterium]|nr:Multidrug export protein EmrA [Chlamydiia bacterium]MCH9615456.1 Multidrug export protein EmrA [Chlamydiia bacterium]MCH9629111.1 Multidrug export protein EmrA [Chlamydiia bacterium]
MTKKTSLTFFGVILALLVIGSLIWLFKFRLSKYTDDAYVQGNQIVLTPLVDGFVTNIYTDETFLVEKGQLIIQLDDTDAKIALEDAAENLATVTRQVCQMFHQTDAYQSEIEVRKAELIKARQDYTHRIDVIEAGGVSLENLEHAEAALKANFFLLKETESLYQKELAMIQGDTIPGNPLVKAALDRYLDAWVNLYRTKIYAPNEGLIAERKAQVGMYFKAGDPLLNIIPLDQIWVNANYKETQMKRMRIGQSVELTADIYGDDVVYHGRIVGLPGGAGNAFSILPPQNLSGNWIKIVQRLPVRVALRSDEVKQNPLRIGLTMTARTNVRNTDGKRVPETNKGAPNYNTHIFLKEMEGAKAAGEKIIASNLDPNLFYYKDHPFEQKELPSISMAPHE